MLAVVEAMADMEGFAAEYERAKTLRHGLDELFMAVEDKTAEIVQRAKEGPGESR